MAASQYVPVLSVNSRDQFQKMVLDLLNAEYKTSDNQVAKVLHRLMELGISSEINVLKLMIDLLDGGFDPRGVLHCMDSANVFRRVFTCATDIDDTFFNTNPAKQITLLNEVFNAFRRSGLPAQELLDCLRRQEPFHEQLCKNEKTYLDPIREMRALADLQSKTPKTEEEQKGVVSTAVVKKVFDFLKTQDGSKFNVWLFWFKLFNEQDARLSLQLLRWYMEQGIVSPDEICDVLQMQEISLKHNIASMVVVRFPEQLSRDYIGFLLQLLDRGLDANRVLDLLRLENIEFRKFVHRLAPHGSYMANLQYIHLLTTLLNKGVSARAMLSVFVFNFTYNPLAFDCKKEMLDQKSQQEQEVILKDRQARHFLARLIGELLMEPESLSVGSFADFQKFIRQDVFLQTMVKDYVLKKFEDDLVGFKAFAAKKDVVRLLGHIQSDDLKCGFDQSQRFALSGLSVIRGVVEDAKAGEAAVEMNEENIEDRQEFGLRKRK